VKPLGRGSFSKVILAEPFETTATSKDVSLDGTLPEYIAIKVVLLEAVDDAPAERIASSARRELDILKRISHPSITRLLAYKECPQKCLFGLKFSAGGDLFDFASRHRGLLTPILVKRTFRELALAVLYLHEEMYVVHRDLKLESQSPPPPPPQHTQRTFTNSRHPLKLHRLRIRIPYQLSIPFNLPHRPWPIPPL